MKCCDITKKTTQYGRNRSHSLRSTPKKFAPNLQTKTYYLNGKKLRLKLATSTIRTIETKGLEAVIKKHNFKV